MDPSKITSSASQPLWKYISASELKWLRAVLTIVVTAMTAVSLYKTNWHNDGFSWYLHNTQMMTSTIALWILSIASEFPTVSSLDLFGKSTF